MGRSPPSPPSNGSPGATRPMIPTSPPASPMFLIFSVKLQAPRSTSTILPAERAGRERVAAEEVAAGAVAVLHRSLDRLVSGADHGWKTAGKLPGDVGRGDDLHQRQERARHAVCATDRAPSPPRRGAVRVRLVAAVAGRGDRQDAEPGRVVHRRGQVVVERLAVVGEPSDMLMMSTRSFSRPSPFGSSANSMPWISAMPEQDVDTDEQTFTAYRSTPGATPSGAADDVARRACRDRPRARRRAGPGRALSGPPATRCRRSRSRRRPWPSGTCRAR
jgi:hypothetical protein